MGARGWAACVLLMGCLPAAAPAGAGDPTLARLAKCAAVSDAAARLACYDAIARPPAPGPTEPPAAAPAIGPAAIQQAPAVASPDARENFGNYQAEHPTVQKQNSISGNVTAIGESPAGRTRLTLSADGGVWELLDSADPLLRVGDAVTIRRATFNSFILTTSTRREHRVRRLQ